MLNFDRSAEFLARCLTHHAVDIQIHLLDMHGNFIQNVSNGLIDGSVDIDADATITRSASLKWFDPGSVMNLSFNNVNESGGYLARQIRIYYGVGHLSSNPDWIYAPIITGPVVNLSRNGFYMDIEVQGKEVLASDGMIHEVGFSAGLPVRDLIHLSMFFQTGEVDYNMAFPPNVLGSDFLLEPGDNLFEQLKIKVADANHQLFYNGWGHLVLRPNPEAPVYTFNGRSITQNPTVDYNDSEVTNCVRLEGGIPIGATTPIVYFIYAPDWHPLSPTRLGRNGIPRFLPEFIEDDSIANWSDAVYIAERALANGLMKSVSTQFSALVIPILEENDVVAVNGVNYYGNTRTTKMTIPLVGDSDMSVGFLSRRSTGSISSSEMSHQMKMAKMRDRQNFETDEARERAEYNKRMAKEAKKKKQEEAKRRKEQREKKRKLKKSGETGLFQVLKKSKRSKRSKK